MLINQGSNSSQLSNDKIIEAKGPIENSINIRNVLKIKVICLYFFIFTAMKQREMPKNKLLLKQFLIGRFQKHYMNKIMLQTLQSSIENGSFKMFLI